MLPRGIYIQNKNVYTLHFRPPDYLSLEARQATMDEYQKRLSCLQKRVAYDVIINNYDFLVGCVDAVRIFPCLVSSRLVEPDFRQFLDGERTDKDKMMALLTELTRRPEGTWFDRFTNALSKFPQYHTVADVLLTGNPKSNCPGVK